MEWAAAARAQVVVMLLGLWARGLMQLKDDSPAPAPDLRSVLRECNGVLRAAGYAADACVCNGAHGSGSPLLLRVPQACIDAWLRQRQRQVHFVGS